MRDQLALGEQGSVALERSRAEAFDVARARVLEPNSPNTQRAYKQAFGQWTAYCDALGMSWAPIDAAELVTYAEQLGRRLAPNSVRLHLSALCELDKASRVTPSTPSPQSLREHPIVQRWEKSWTREHPRRARKQAAALAQGELERLLAAAAEPLHRAARAAHAQRYVRDRCLILFGVCGAFRGSDLTELELGDIHVGERGLRVLLRRSKTDQQGEGADVGLMPQGRLSLCPVDAFLTWRKLRGDTPGPLFVAISRSAELELGRRMSERQITRLVAEYAQRAGLGLQVSAHSLRATFATLAASRGKSLDRIMSHGRWASADVALGYMRQGQLFDDNASAGLLE
jgi:integrase